jgi:hypothetical protein
MTRVPGDGRRSAAPAAMEEVALSKRKRDKYQEYEQACAQIRTENGELLAAFEALLKGRSLAAKTVKEHILNVSFYINEFLLYYEPMPAKEGASRISEFLGDWFVRKALWSSRNSIRGMAASLKKFYGHLAAQGVVTSEDLDGLKATIKEEMPDWLDNVEKFYE